ncbi:head-tail connector protein [Paracoccus sp. MC1862]|nr:head-tail connector protein [Paracoccus sp. MC1862]
MTVADLQELMAQAGLTGDAPSSDLLLLQQKGDAAQNHIERLLGYRIDAMFGGPGLPPVPEALKEAVLQLACWWFENREAAADRERHLPFGVKDIVNEYRGWTF